MVLAASSLEAQTAPAISTQPITQVVTTGQSVTLRVVATGSATLTYQWLFNGAPLATATAATYTVANFLPANAGDYTVTVTNTVGSVTSAAATLTYGPPAVTTQPRAQTAAVGASITLTVVATGNPITYQWTFNGAAIAGATAASLVLNPVTAAQGGVYAVAITDGGGTTTSANAALLVYAPYVVRTLAGQTGVSGSADGNSTSATFFNPEGIAVDAAGTVFVVDTVNGTIRKVTAAGGVSTLAGTPGVVGSADGTGAAAQFNYPAGIAVDSADNVYVADTFNSTIRKITPAGVVTTLAGLAPTAANPSPTNTGSTNGTGGAARFNFPRGLAVDGAGNVYVADTVNSTIRKVTPAGVVTTLAGNAAQPGQTLDGTGAAARFDYPFGIASDSAGDIWVADTSGQTIRAITPAGVVTTLAGLAGNAGSAGGLGAVARFNNPAAIAVDGAGNLYVADTNNSTLREISPAGLVTTLAGTAGSNGSVDAAGTGARLFFPFGIAVDSAGNLYFADTYNATIRAASPQSPVQVAPVILTQPAGATVNAGATVVLSVTASGNPAPTYQWFNGAAAVSGATSSILTLANIQPGAAGSYTAVATNPIGSATSNAAAVAVTAPPVVSVPPQSQSVSAGSTVNLTVTIPGAASYQWSFNGMAISGATAATLTLTNVGANQAGSYTVVGTNSAGSVTSVAAVVTVGSDASLINLSARANVGTGGNLLIAGFVTSGTGTKQILIRGGGPSLAGAPFNLTGTLSHPQLTLFNSSQAVVSTNTGWGGSAALTQVFSQVGAYPYVAGAADSALLATVTAGLPYTAQISGVGNTGGVALAELYDADGAAPTARLVNLSARANVGTGGNVLIAGFVISGTASETVLIRGVGPALALAPFSLTGVLAAPLLTVFNGAGTSLATNTRWGGTSTLTATFVRVGAFSLGVTSNDTALLLTLAPGSYTAQVSGVNNTSGQALVEVYEVR